ncbi:GFA family protein [Shewanella benthica]|uniref:GFA family protein n=1 Tax=Shewanella benthica TaxID=43661 RepID=UPI001879BEB8|nr:GFA family protein [Shewanella benthica]MBE7216803.1 GFA family protein [Shewanella benthica]MCL1065147.1 GFA family protein [Shewanella benthica]
MTMETEIQGGCLCGALRYSVSEMPFDSDHCHCRMCQKSTGAVVGSWMDFLVEQVTWLCGKPSEYASSDTTRRGFCSTCGTSISFRDTGHPTYYTLSIASLDDPNLVAVKYHIHTDNQLKWLTIEDDLPRYSGSRS